MTSSEFAWNQNKNHSHVTSFRRNQLATYSKVNVWSITDTGTNLSKLLVSNKQSGFKFYGCFAFWNNYLPDGAECRDTNKKIEKMTCEIQPLKLSVTRESISEGSRFNQSKVKREFDHILLCLDLYLQILQYIISFFTLFVRSFTLLAIFMVCQWEGF